MNLEELKVYYEEKIEKAKDYLTPDIVYPEDLSIKQSRLNLFQNFLANLEQLEEIKPEKPIIPQYVADWIEYCKVHEYSLHTALNEFVPTSLVAFCGYYHKTRSWLTDYDFAEKEELFARAWVNGYTAEKPMWVVKYIPKGSTTCWYFIGFIGGDKPMEPNCATPKNCETVIKFTDKDKAEAVATLINGVVEEA